MNTVKQYLFMRLPWSIRTRIDVVDDCWLWRGEINRNGYGRAYHKGKREMVHRLVWRLVGRELEDGKVLDHVCRNRDCCNPTHISQVSIRHNTHRGKAKLFKKANGQ